MKQRKILLKHIKEVFEKPVTCNTLFTDDKQTSVEIVSSVDSPAEGITSYATIGASEGANFITKDKQKLRVEFVGLCDSRNTWFSSLLSTCAFSILHGMVNAQPYTVYKNSIAIYQPHIDMQHLLLVPPFSFANEFHTIETDENELVAWLMLNPISENEFQYMQKNGIQKLLQAFEEQQINVANIYRKSIF